MRLQSGSIESRYNKTLIYISIYIIIIIICSYRINRFELRVECACKRTLLFSSIFFFYSFNTLRNWTLLRYYKWYYTCAPRRRAATSVKYRYFFPQFLCPNLDASDDDFSGRKHLPNITTVFFFCGFRTSGLESDGRLSLNSKPLKKTRMPPGVIFCSRVHTLVNG